ncbi:MAG: hypothetical protein LC808_44705, partial [Actinobacteria bacterium]|nr:hypothetical protein [Actinomycetota bacterium]
MKQTARISPAIDAARGVLVAPICTRHVLRSCVLANAAEWLGDQRTCSTPASQDAQIRVDRVDERLRAPLYLLLRAE